MPASAEFISLCRSQVALLTQGMGAALSVVYLTERLVEEGTAQEKLIPVVAYPESAVRWKLELNSAALPATTSRPQPPRLKAKATAKNIDTVSLPELPTEANVAEAAETADKALVPSQQIVLPLLNEGVLIGLLVTSREDRAWNERERHEIERVAQTLTLARLLDRRRERSEQQLSQQKQLQAQQRELLDNLLHQFRNPLTALRTFGKLLLKRLLPGDANRAVADNIVRESDRLQELLQQFDRVIDMTEEDLEPTKSLPPATEVRSAIPILNPPLPLLPNREGTQSEICTIEDVLKPLLASAWAIAQERSLDLQADLPPNLPAVRAHLKELREVLSNLLDNAIKYTPPGGKIYVQAGLERDNCQGIAISDTGVGIPPQDKERIFDRHYRGRQADSDIPGTGLGLAIAKALIEQMQGTIEVFSPALWHPTPESSGGTTFIVWLLVDG
ncbi:MAG: Adaptive-response sensory-kinase SasA [Chroococcidiopsis sp. SAG 2025]|uniref:sensor histidine kinase n=1 Tax=Chroococcidiopsis sp. SAG 2025 TaxID=171389 RepID=UPI0029371443|nr:HAMP domain-containing sensor histidine kinase [Chroococcidiopsis sp. SAG 2025]MDV2991055.1 Adaptive-response sensory-kinase SasA [Chroococcidiopsis sp. SAG 2025]